MKQTVTKKRHSRVSEDLRSEYRLDYSKAKRNRFAGGAQKVPVVVILDDDVARVFKTPEAVNAVLRAIVATLPTRKKSPARKRDVSRQ